MLGLSDKGETRLYGEVAEAEKGVYVGASRPTFVNRLLRGELVKATLFTKTTETLREKAQNGDNRSLHMQKLG